MKKTAIKIIIYSVLYFVFVFLVNAVFIRPNLIKFYGNEPSPYIFQQTFIGVFVPISFIVPAFFVMFIQVGQRNLRRIIILSVCYILLTFIAFLLFTTPGFSVLSILTFLLILTSFITLIFSIDYFLTSLKIPAYWRGLIVVVVVFAMITSVLWMNPILEESATSKTVSLAKMVDIAITVNPAIVSIDKVFGVSIFRSGNFYSHSGAEGLSMIGDYFGSVDYIDQILMYPLIYLLISVVFIMPGFMIQKFKQRKNMA